MSKCLETWTEETKEDVNDQDRLVKIISEIDEKLQNILERLEALEGK
tara:strand:- start:1204 stop:1344 length:141 start_codon:yes stop_codon:yes gene_type:complete